MGVGGVQGGERFFKAKQWDFAFYSPSIKWPGACKPARTSRQAPGRGAPADFKGGARGRGRGGRPRCAHLSPPVPARPPLGEGRPEGGGGGRYHSGTQTPPISGEGQAPAPRSCRGKLEARSDPRSESSLVVAPLTLGAWPAGTLSLPQSSFPGPLRLPLSYPPHPQACTGLGLPRLIMVARGSLLWPPSSRVGEQGCLGCGRGGTPGGTKYPVGGKPLSGSLHRTLRCSENSMVPHGAHI